MQYARALKVIRATRGLTQSDLAERSGLNRSQIAQIESGRRVPALKALEALADALEVPMYLLMLIASDEKDIKDIDGVRAGALGVSLLELLTAVENGR